MRIVIHVQATGATFTLEINLDATVQELYERVMLRLRGLVPHRGAVTPLSYNGQQPQMGYSLADYGISSGAEITL